MHAIIFLPICTLIPLHLLLVGSFFLMCIFLECDVILQEQQNEEESIFTDHNYSKQEGLVRGMLYFV